LEGLSWVVESGQATKARSGANQTSGKCSMLQHHVSFSCPASFLSLSLSSSLSPPFVLSHTHTHKHTHRPTENFRPSSGLSFDTTPFDSLSCVAGCQLGIEKIPTARLDHVSSQLRGSMFNILNTHVEFGACIIVLSTERLGKFLDSSSWPITTSAALPGRTYVRLLKPRKPTRHLKRLFRQPHICASTRPVPQHDWPGKPQAPEMSGPKWRSSTQIAVA
jgi:hypothetical protein